MDTNTLAFTFDTLRYSKRLTDAGLDPKIAEAEAEILSETLSAALGSAALVTKYDLHQAVAEIKASIIQWVAALLVAQAAAIAALVKLL